MSKLGLGWVQIRAVMIGEIFGHNNRLRSLAFASPTGYMLLTSSGFALLALSVGQRLPYIKGNFGALLSNNY